MSSMEHRGRPASVLCTATALLSGVVLLRLPGFAFDVLNIDETDYALYGASILRGDVPYRDIAEIKPPLGPLTHLPAGMFGGIDLSPMHVLGVLWVFASAWLVGRAAREALDDDVAGWAGAWLFLAATQCDLPAFSSEVMVNLPTAAALVFFVRACRTGRASSVACTALCISAASLYKHQGALPLVPLGGWLVWLAWREPAPWRRRLRASLRTAFVLAAAFALPWLLCLGSFAAAGLGSVFVDQVFLWNLAYATRGATGGAWSRFLQSTLVCVAGTLVPWVLAVRESFRPSTQQGWARVRPGAVAMLWCTWLAVAAGGRFYEHYYLQFAPALALLGAPSAAGLARRLSSFAWPRRVALGAALLVPPLALATFAWVKGALGQYPAQDPRAKEVGGWLRAHSKPEDRLFVWGHYTPIYFLAQRLPGTRYFNTSMHMGNFDPAHLPEGFEPARFASQPDVEATLEDLERRRPAWVVDTAPADIHHWHKVPLAAFPTLAGYITAHYERVAEPGGSVVYRRVDDPRDSGP